MINNFMSQEHQDEIALDILGKRDRGFFVELGACDGIYLSNTYYFEKELNWGGILIEPNPNYIDDLRRNRGCFISNSLCSYDKDIEVDFLLSDVVSGIITDSPGRWIRENINKDRILLRTNLLSNVLDEFNAPDRIDFLSLDVEGHEFDILSTFPFDRYCFELICVEHNAYWEGNYNKDRIRELLISRGYRLVREIRLDDFYLKNC